MHNRQPIHDTCKYDVEYCIDGEDFINNSACILYGQVDYKDSTLNSENGIIEPLSDTKIELSGYSTNDFVFDVYKINGKKYVKSYTYKGYTKNKLKDTKLCLCL